MVSRPHCNCNVNTYEWLKYVGTRLAHEVDEIRCAEYQNLGRDLGGDRSAAGTVLSRLDPGGDFLVRLEGFEPPTLGSEDRCSIR